MGTRLALATAVGLVAQAGVLGRIAALPAGRAAALAAVFGLAGGLLVAGRRRLAPAAGGLAAMLGLGGLGMTLGGWLDLALASSAGSTLSGVESSPTAWCGAFWPHPAGAGPFAHTLSFMDAGMLALGLPAMAAAHAGSVAPSGRPAPRRGWLRAAGGLACAAGMVAGMDAGGWVAARLAPFLAGAAPVLADHALMSAGMTAGMLAAALLARIAAAIHYDASEGNRTRDRVRRFRHAAWRFASR